MPRDARRLVPLDLALALFACATLAAQTPQQPTFRGEARTVPVYVTVTDGAGGFATDLTRDDFEVRDNGKLQAITQFTTDAQPLSVLLLIDGSSSMMGVLNSVIEAANVFIVRMLPADRTGIGSFADRFEMRQPFTSNRDELLAHLQNQFNIRLGLETRLWEGLWESVIALREEKGRRVVLVLSDGKNWVAGATSFNTLPRRGAPGTPPRTVTVPSAPSSVTPGSVLTTALTRDVMIYAVSVWTRFEGAAEAPDQRMSQLAEDTGGGFIELRESDDILTTVAQISRELHQQYVLGFQPQVLDGKLHKLDVRVKRAHGSVRARRSYVAEIEKK
jgi:Ca-activated chloride channel family protein